MNSIDPWLSLHQELDNWSAQDTPATFWWRDDDAIAPGPKLDRLIGLTANTGLLLAVIPAIVQRTLPSSLANIKHVYVAQHGYAHINHAPRGQGLGAWEIGLHRGEAAVMDDLAKGWDVLENLFETGFLPVLVPPWNRIDPALFSAIAAKQYLYVSAFGPRDPEQSVAGLIQVNSHCDPIRWKGGAHFGGDAKTLDQLTHHLQARRTGAVDASEPTGFLTHHIDLDSEGWDFCTKLASFIDQHPAAQWCQPDSVFNVGACEP